MSFHRSRMFLFRSTAINLISLEYDNEKYLMFTSTRNKKHNFKNNTFYALKLNNFEFFIYLLLNTKLD